MITSIGNSYCFLQSFLYFKFKNESLFFTDNILSRIAPYPENWGIDIVQECLSNYDVFCKDFLNTGEVIISTDHGPEYISKTCKCKIHYSKKMNLKQMCLNLTNADIVLIRLRFGDPILELKSKCKLLQKIINKDFKIIAFSADIASIKKIDNSIIYPWNCPVFKTKDDIDYVPGWKVSNSDVILLENIWSNIKQYA